MEEFEKPRDNARTQQLVEEKYLETLQRRRKGAEFREAVKFFAKFDKAYIQDWKITPISLLRNNSKLDEYTKFWLNCYDMGRLSNKTKGEEQNVYRK